ncbi:MULTISPECIES: L-threonylcarbamoyladenylate synthase [unclassified Enterococcus]|uniref:L-threonylcarbamoyladenylate synthase n=1 Tax=unclassified Enterococcus TaxID=2608891 RepID=UPI0015564335|nr:MULTISPECIES: L-threonylcarbamoyladenylate synthase [unclassified Enterococcus]MBS7576394.1 threonylcarbamoyl-AMP synthase [Enterococcus sp. MMGLQ5-2]MBS7583626.1 threonylcarbamoyl-AMP synthase [Enterococcus sp. MMGLQ5-1]NPD11487.1 threonylcarbamoyl-AMP synthase [Enterococcus sp. MMGLQ5-1]NPD36231.1 threonylcarbamoyl-AMP synthase [Enterococcus sp. MMGLQ5-2]
MTEILKANSVGIDKAVRFLKAGELVAFPTETVYGLGAPATDSAAVRAVFQAKGRPSDNPLIVHVSNLSMVERYAKKIPKVFYQLVEQFWPGSLTLILEAKNLPDEVTAGLSTVAFRMPDSQLTLNLIEQLGTPIVGPSANTSGKPSPTKAAHVFHDLDGKISAILDGGSAKIGVESTVVDLTGKTPLILRPGKVTLSDLKVILPKLEYDRHLISDEEIPKAPGMKYQHYSPSVSVFMVTGAEISRIPDQADLAIVADESFLSNFRHAHTFVLSNNQSIEMATRNLYQALRQFDQSGISAIFVEVYAGENARAYMNRLQKASGGKSFTDFHI